jgi:hypothetical protein
MHESPDSDLRTPKHPEDLLHHNRLTDRSGPLRSARWHFPGVNDDKPLAIRGTLRSNESEALDGSPRRRIASKGLVP